MKHDDPAETQVHEEACYPYDEEEDEAQDDSTLPEGDDIQGRYDIFS